MSYDKFTYSTENASILWKILRENPDRPAEGIYSKNSPMSMSSTTFIMSLYFTPHRNNDNMIARTVEKTQYVLQRKSVTMGITGAWAPKLVLKNIDQIHCCLKTHFLLF